MTLKEERKWSHHCLQDKGTNSLSMLLRVSFIGLDRRFETSQGRTNGDSLGRIIFSLVGLDGAPELARKGFSG
jgi:hypothetical protein